MNLISYTHVAINVTNRDLTKFREVRGSLLASFLL